MSAPVLVEPVGPDDLHFDAWHAAVATAYAAGREPGWWESLPATRAYFSRPEGRTRHRALVALSDGAVVGGAEVSLPLDADLTTFSVELGVPPEHRGAGVGSALWDAVVALARAEGRSVAQAEVFVPSGVAEAEWPGARFAVRRGLACASVEHRFVLSLPVDLDALPDVPGDEVVSWVGPCPEDRVAEWARMQTLMNQDVPTGDLTVTPRTADVERIRESDRTMAEQGWTKVRSMAVGPDGTGLGYTELFVSDHDPHVVVQDDTWVARDQRGRRLGTRLKVANLRLLQRHPGLLGERSAVQTYCEQDNHAMRRTNADLGFRLVDELREYEGDLGATAS